MLHVLALYTPPRAVHYWGMNRYPIGDAAVELVCGDITRSDTDAIANAANAMLSGGGGVDGAIHRAAGGELMDSLRAIKRGLPGGMLDTGGAVITPGFELEARHVIHCVGPIYDREAESAPELLASCYSEAIRLCREHDIDSVSFPSISTGVYGYPVEKAAVVALGAVRRALEERAAPHLCRFVLFDQATFDAYAAAADVGLA